MPSKATTGVSRDTPLARSDVSETPAQPRSHSPAEIDQEQSGHLVTVLSVSSGMVGVCLTAIGLVGIMKTMNQKEMLVDDLLAIGSLVFVIASLMSFFGMRSRLARQWRGLTPLLDCVFCLGFVLVVVATVILTWLVI